MGGNDAYCSSRRASARLNNGSERGGGKASACGSQPASQTLPVAGAAISLTRKKAPVETVREHRTASSAHFQSARNTASSPPPSACPPHTSVPPTFFSPPPPFPARVSATPPSEASRLIYPIDSFPLFLPDAALQTPRSPPVVVFVCAPCRKKPVNMGGFMSRIMSLAGMGKKEIRILILGLVRLASPPQRGALSPYTRGDSSAPLSFSVIVLPLIKTPFC